MGVIFKIRNVGNGPFKVKFLPNTPKELLKQVKGLVKTGGKVTIPANLVPHVDKAHLNRCATLGVVHIKEAHIRVPEPVKPMKRRRGRPRKDETEKAGTKSSTKVSKDKDTKSELGGD